MILAGVPIIVAVAFSLTPHDARSSDTTEASGHHVTVSDLTAVAAPAGGDDQSAGSTSLVALAVDPNGHGRRDGWKPDGHRDGDKKDGDKKDGDKKPTHKPTKPTETKTTAPPTKPPTTPPTVQPTRTELPVTGGREVSFAVAGAGLVLIGALMLLLRRMARDQ